MTSVAPADSPASTYDATLSRCTFVTSGPMSVSFAPSPIWSVRGRSAIFCTSVSPGSPGDFRHGRVAGAPDGAAHADPHAALAGRAVPGADGGVRGQVEVGVGE